MKSTLLTGLFALIFSFSSAYSQCSYQKVTLSSQVAVDNFVNNISGCPDVSIEDLVIGFEGISGATSDITDISGLMGISSLESLVIVNNPLLTSLQGLNALSVVTSVLQIGSNASLQNMSGLNGLMYAGALLIIDNAQLVNLQGLVSLNAIYGTLAIQQNAQLVSLEGLNLTILDGALVIRLNPLLKNLDELSSLYAVRGDIALWENENLEDITGLANIDPNSITDTLNVGLMIQDNPKVTVCNLSNLCAYLSIPGNRRTISGNGGNCASNFLLKLSCEAPTAADLALFDLVFVTQQDVDDFGSFYAGNSGLTVKSITIGDPATYTDVSDLGPLQIIDTIVEDLTIAMNPVLPNLDGLNELKIIGGNLMMQMNPALLDVQGLSKLKTIGGIFFMAFHPQLQSFSGFESLTTVGDVFLIAINESITNVDGFSSLKSVGGSLAIGQNPLLTNLNGFANLTSISGELVILENEVLNDISGLSNIHPSTIFNVTGEGLAIVDNPLLSVCNLPNFCAYLHDPANVRNISGNDQDCISEAAVMANCIPCTEPVNVLVKAVNTESAKLSWEGDAPAYEIEWGPQGFIPGSGTLISDITDLSYVITGLEEENSYEFYLRSACLYMQSDWMGPFNLYMGYCTPQLDCTDGDLITRVVFGDIDNSTSCSPNGYGNYRHLSTNIAPGQSYPISVDVGSGWHYESVSVWIDFNRDFNFDEEEFFFIGTGSGETVQGTIPIPSDLEHGDFVMRVRVAATGTEHTYDLACDESLTYGETEDYTLQYHLRDFVFDNDVWTPEDPSGICLPTENITVLNGVAFLTADTEAANISIAPLGVLIVEKVLDLHGDLSIAGDIVFHSTAVGTGELGYVNPASVITGEAVVENYFIPRRAYRMVSSSVTTYSTIHDNWQERATSRSHNPMTGFGTHITGTKVDQTNGFDSTETGNPSMFTVDVPAQQFVPIDNTDQNKLVAGDSYLMFIRGDRSVDLDSNDSFSETVLRAKGLLHTGDQTQSFNTSSAGSFAMFGNPYQSAVDVNKLFSNSSNVNPSVYYVYDDEFGDYGSYIPVALPNGTNGLGSSVNQYLQPGQAAQYATLAAGASSVTFTEDAKAPGNGPVTSARGFVDSDKINIQLFITSNLLEGKRPHDGVTFLFDAQYDNALTFEDAPKAMNFRENLGIDNNGSLLSIEKRALPEASEVFNLYTTGYTRSNYTFKVDLHGLEGNVFYLDDAFTGNSFLLEAGENLIDFSVSEEAGKAKDRFSIRVEERLGVASAISAGIRLFPNPMNEDSFYIYLPNFDRDVEVSISDLSGRQIYKAVLPTVSNKVTVTPANALASGVYLVQLKLDNEVQTFRLARE